MRVRAQNLFSVKQGRRVCGVFRASPHPLIPVSLSESETRRVPAPSHLAQRDVAKTHVSPGPCSRAPGAKLNCWVTFTWRTCRFGGYRTANRQPKNCTRSSPFSQGRNDAGSPSKASTIYSLSGSALLWIWRTFCSIAYLTHSPWDAPFLSNWTNKT